MRLRHLAALAVFSVAVPVAAQSDTDHIALGDQAHEALNPAAAVVHYEAAIAADALDYEALWKAARDLADLAEFETDRSAQATLFRRSEAYARRAVAVRPEEAEAHFHLARALGQVALTLGVKERVRYASAVRDAALTALRYDPDHAGALHVLGRWNAEVMRLSGVERFFARRFLGGKIFNSASWDQAEQYLKQAVEVDPERLTHSLDLAEIYADRGKKAKAREQLERVIVGRATQYGDLHYKARAERLMRRLR